ncbi:alpha amylase N-terminal ig-like domain-containing protein [Succinivibrio sp.]|uniref:alpha amylase N-terminal ig-like domain-containing protein n=1 Tax=Succinivibrio sp. TaxID=2053619 RepID=UPI0038671B38
MKLEGISHISGFNDCYAYNKDELIVNIRTNKTIKKVVIFADDPYINGCSTSAPWDGQPYEMQLKYELKHEFIYSVTLRPRYKRLQYYFRLTDDNNETMVYQESGIVSEEEFQKKIFREYFKFAWMNEADISVHPKWVENTYWYQIFPDRFCREEAPFEGTLSKWDDLSSFGHNVFYGGNLKGAMSRLEYLHELGVNGIYFNPLFVSDSNHKYNIDDYLHIDPNFGSNVDLKLLVEKAHSLGIKVMIDAVFNHSGLGFFAWKDVVENRRNSKYYDWFFINDEENFTITHKSTKDSRFYSFAFVDNMPKLNTNNPEVMSYFIEVCKKWIDMWDIDGIRFDVGNEISHAFIKKLHAELKAYRKDLFLLGEIWVNSSQYLQGDEYDSVMNYPYLENLSNFFLDKSRTAEDFKYAVNFCYSMYQKQVNENIFNLFDSHDIDRMYTRVKSYDAFIQMLVILSTLPGSPCIYYGTEIAMEGENDPYCRYPMRWDIVEDKSREDTFKAVQSLIKMRLSNSEFLGDSYRFEKTEGRLVCYERNGIRVYLNADETDRAVAFDKESEILFSHKASGNMLKAGGALVVRLKK